jgi:hypothetical protein
VSMGIELEEGAKSLDRLRQRPFLHAGRRLRPWS